MRQLTQKQQMLATAVVVAVAAGVLYWPILSLPLSFDDLLHIRLVKGMDYLSVWEPTDSFGFYRPVLFLPVLLTRSLFGSYPSPFVYAQNLLLHSLDSILVALLVFRLWRRWPRALAAGLLFATYPFAFQAVAVFGNNIYPLLVCLILLMLHAYLQALDGKKRWWLVTAVLFVIGLFTHELIVLFGIFAALVQWAYQQRLPILDYSLPWKQPVALIRQSPFVVFLLAGGFYILIYQFLPIAGPPAAAGGNLPGPRLLYLLQAVVYPLADLFNQIMNQSAPPLIGASLLILLVLSLWAGRERENRPALLLGWGWWGISSLLLFLTLPTNYVVHGPRLVYLGSVGTSMIWAVVLDQLFNWRRFGRLMWTAVLVSILLFSSLFVRGRLAALSNIGSPVALFKEVMAERPLAEGVLLVNFPAYIAPVENTFPVGVEHVALMGSHIFAEEIVWENLNQVRPVLSVAVPELLSDPGYPYGTHQQSDLPTNPADWAEAGAHVFVSEYTEAGVQPVYTGRVSPAAAEQPPLAAFGDYALMGATAMACQNSIHTEITWQLLQEPSPLSSVFVQALAADGRVVGQQDGPPLKLRPDLIEIPEGWQIIDGRELDLEPDQQAEQLLIGVYNYQTGERFPAKDGNDTPLADNALRLPIETCSSD